MFALKSTLTQQIFTGSHYGQGSGLADRWIDKRKAFFCSAWWLWGRLRAGKSQCPGDSVLLEAENTEALPNYATILPDY